MHVTSRSYLTAGVAALGVGAIALSPIQPIPNQVALAPERVVSNLSVDLVGIIDPWVAAFGTATENAARLNAAWTASTFPIFQTFVSNQLYYASEFPQIGEIAKQIFGNLLAAPAAPFVADPDNVSETVVGVTTGLLQIPVSQKFIYNVVTGPASPLPPELNPLIEFMTTPFSGAALAVIGPVIGPVLSFANDVKTIFAQLQARNLPAAFNTFMAIAPNAVNAFLNGGQVLDLTSIVNRISPLPEDVRSIGLNMGGLVSSGLSPVEGEVSKGVTGTMFDGLATDASISVSPVVKLGLDSPGLSVGPIGATQLLTKKIAEAIKQPKITTAAAVAPAAAEAAVEAAEAEAEAPAAVEAPAPKKQTRATARADRDAGKSARSERASRRAG